MARKPKRPCNQPGCRTLTSEGRCEEHRHYYNRYRGLLPSRAMGTDGSRQERATCRTTHCAWYAESKAYVQLPMLWTISFHIEETRNSFGTVGTGSPCVHLVTHVRQQWKTLALGTVVRSVDVLHRSNWMMKEQIILILFVKRVGGLQSLQLFHKISALQLRVHFFVF